VGSLPLGLLFGLLDDGILLFLLGKGSRLRLVDSELLNTRRFVRGLISLRSLDPLQFCVSDDNTLDVDLALLGLRGE
jgi:hypothetical protein